MPRDITRHRTQKSHDPNNSLQIVAANDEVPCRTYVLTMAHVGCLTSQAVLEFQHGSIFNGNFGVTDAGLLAIVRDRLEQQIQQDPQAHRKSTIRHLTVAAALDWCLRQMALPEEP